MLGWLFHAPRLALEAFVRPTPEVARARRDFPKGGMCHRCGKPAEADAIHCEKCYDKQQW
jgi:hypothetical protein